MSLWMCLCFFRTGDLHQFVKIILTKNSKKRPAADKLLQVITQWHYDDDDDGDDSEHGDNWTPFTLHLFHDT